MSKVRTFSRHFPKGHPKQGEQTHFVEQIWNALKQLDLPLPKNSDFTKEFMWSILPLSHFGCKWHTIRAGKHFKVGDWFSPRVWTDKPYSSKLITIAPDIQIKKIWDIWHDENGWWINGNSFYAIERLAQNDGLSVQDFLDWFNVHPKNKGETFTGQILCWSNEVEY